MIGQPKTRGWKQRLRKTGAPESQRISCSTCVIHLNTIWQYYSSLRTRPKLYVLPELFLIMAGKWVSFHEHNIIFPYNLFNNFIVVKTCEFSIFYKNNPVIFDTVLIIHKLWKNNIMLKCIAFSFAHYRPDTIFPVRWEKTRIKSYKNA